MKLVRIAARNVLRNRRSYLVGGIMAAGIAVFFVGNSLLDGTDAGIRSSFISSFTSDLAVSGVSDESFSVFGDETPIIGALAHLPTIVPFDDVRAYVESRPEVAADAAQVSGLALLEAGNYRSPAPLFGVEGTDYFAVFNGIRITRGRALGSGERGILLPEPRAGAAEYVLKRKLKLGELVQLSVADNSTFRIRAVPLVGVYSYPLESPTLDSIVLVDADTLRALYGMTRGTPEAVQVSPAQTELLSADVEDLFAQAGRSDGHEPEAAFSREEMEATLAASGPAAREAPTDSSAWHFLFVRLKPGVDVAAFCRSLDTEFKSRGWPVETRDWRETAGTSALFAYWLRVIFNVAFGIAAFAALIIIVNSLSISIHERSGEIGTMRALGATKGFVRLLFVLETCILSFVSGFVGVAIGTGMSLLLRKRAFVLENPFLVQLFGGKLLRPEISSVAILRGMALALLIGALAWIYPVRLALRVQPRQAMSGEAE
jgi:putative ABC transport system permease protein